MDLNLGSNPISTTIDSGAKLLDSISGLVNADEKMQTELSRLIYSNNDKILQSINIGQQESTKRAVADSQSDEKSTKTIRPKLAKHAAIVVTILTVILLWFAFVETPTTNQVTIVQSLLAFWGSIYISIIGFYFLPKHKETLARVKELFNFSDKIAPRSTAKGITEECANCGSKEVLPNQFYCKECTG